MPRPIFPGCSMRGTPSETAPNMARFSTGCRHSGLRREAALDDSDTVRNPLARVDFSLAQTESSERGLGVFLLSEEAAP